MFGSRAGGWIHRKMHCRSQSLLWRRLFADRVATTAAAAAATVEAAIATATASATAVAATPATAGHNGGRGMGKTAAAVAPSITVPPPHRLPRLQKLSHPLRLDRAHAMAVATARAVASAAMAATTSAVRWQCVSCTRPKHVERGRRTVSALSPFGGIGMRTDARMQLAAAINYQKFTECSDQLRKFLEALHASRFRQRHERTQSPCAYATTPHGRPENRATDFFFCDAEEAF